MLMKKKHLILLILFGITASAMLAITLTGIICGSDAPTVGLSRATIILDGETDYIAETNAAGQFAIPDVTGETTYQYTISHTGYSPATGNITIGTTNYNMGSIILSEIVPPPSDVQAVANPDFTVTITWDPAGNIAPGYKVWRLLPGQENSEQFWTLLTPQTIVMRTFVDTGWMHTETTKWAVKAVWDNNVLSLPAFSNNLVVPLLPGNVSGYVRNSITQNPVSGAFVQMQNTTFSDTSDTNGYYQIMVWPGIYEVSASATGFADTTSANILISTEDNTNLDIYLRPLTANQDDTETPDCLMSCHPNPFSGQTVIKFSLKATVYNEIGVYNIKGQLVKVLFKQSVRAGQGQTVWNGTDNHNNRVSKGIYYIRMQAGRYQSTRKILLMQ